MCVCVCVCVCMQSGGNAARYNLDHLSGDLLSDQSEAGTEGEGGGGGSHALGVGGEGKQRVHPVSACSLVVQREVEKLALNQHFFRSCIYLRCS
jgi:hypothetical protein